MPKPEIIRLVVGLGLVLAAACFAHPDAPLSEFAYAGLTVLLGIAFAASICHEDKNTKFGPLP